EELWNVFDGLWERLGSFDQRCSDEEGEEGEVDVFLRKMREDWWEWWYKKRKWWVEKFDKRYDLMKEVMDEREEKEYV
ncbi:hypothetical protein, partial [Bacillus velezensis]|uniref:hypothetical protein n=1 Tax=Bacillus velezensis TaxID=492670 RepID=UPI001C92C33D